MIRLERTGAVNPDFVALVRMLDADLAMRDGDDHSFYARYNTLQRIRHVVVAYEGNKAIACGAMKEYAPGVMEIKRMFTLLEERGKGAATNVLAELERWAAELSYTRCVLETGKRQPEAIALYTRCGYTPIPNYGQYAGMENSVCFEKSLHQAMR